MTLWLFDKFNNLVENDFTPSLKFWSGYDSVISPHTNKIEVGAFAIHVSVISPLTRVNLNRKYLGFYNSYIGAATVVKCWMYTQSQNYQKLTKF